MLGTNTLIYSYLLYKSKLVPRPLAVLGLTGATLLLGAALLTLFGADQLSTPNAKLYRGRSGLNLPAPILALLRQSSSPVRFLCSQPNGDRWATSDDDEHDVHARAH